MTSYSLSRNKSESAIRKQQSESQPEAESDVGSGQASTMPVSYQQKEGNRAYAEACKSADNAVYKSTDLGYASDVCDYNVDPKSANNASSNRKSFPQSDTSYLQNQQQSHQRPARPLSMVSMKPLSPSMESSLFDRRQKLIRTRAKVFEGQIDRSLSTPLINVTPVDKRDSTLFLSQVRLMCLNNRRALIFNALCAY